jgi:hypothetical protein
MQFINLLRQNDGKIVISYAVQSESFIDAISITVVVLIDDLLITST